eukprot:Rmarinus@m.24192
MNQRHTRNFILVSVVHGVADAAVEKSILFTAGCALATYRRQGFLFFCLDKLRLWRYYSLHTRWQRSVLTKHNHGKFLRNMRRVFRGWQAVIRTEQMRHSKHLELLRVMFRSWKLAHTSFKYTKALFCRARVWHARRNARKAIRTLFWLIERSRKRRTAAFSSYLVALVRRAFTMLRWHASIRAARRYRVKQLFRFKLARIFRAWVLSFFRRRSVALVAEELCERRRKTCVEVIFLVWQAWLTKQKILTAKSNNLVSLRQRQLALSAWSQWRLRQKRIRYHQRCVKIATDNREIFMCRSIMRGWLEVAYNKRHLRWGANTIRFRIQRRFMSVAWRSWVDGTLWFKRFKEILSACHEEMYHRRNDFRKQKLATFVRRWASRRTWREIWRVFGVWVEFVFDEKARAQQLRRRVLCVQFPLLLRQSFSWWYRVSSRSAAIRRCRTKGLSKKAFVYWRNTIRKNKEQAIRCALMRHAAVVENIPRFVSIFFALRRFRSKQLLRLGYSALHKATTWAKVNDVTATRVSTTRTLAYIWRKWVELVKIGQLERKESIRRQARIHTMKREAECGVTSSVVWVANGFPTAPFPSKLSPPDVIRATDSSERNNAARPNGHPLLGQGVKIIRSLLPADSRSSTTPNSPVWINSDVCFEGGSADEFYVETKETRECTISESSNGSTSEVTDLRFVDQVRSNTTKAEDGSPMRPPVQSLIPHLSQKLISEPRLQDKTRRKQACQPQLGTRGDRHSRNLDRTRPGRSSRNINESGRSGSPVRRSERERDIVCWSKNEYSFGPPQESFIRTLVI